ncbi:MAG: ABC transporter permease subunit [Leptospiraceae bacterium]|nr:ABC transporter permease subunit [Leptospiraceae bacterium]
MYIPILPPGGYEWKNPSYLVLPSLALGSRVFARIYIFTTTEVKKEELSLFVKFLFTRGLSREKIYFKYILLKSFPLLLMFLLLDLSSILSGAMIVEEIFFYPGIGKSMFYAIKSMDTNLLNGLLIYTGITFYIFINLAKKIQTKISDIET